MRIVNVADPTTPIAIGAYHTMVNSVSVAVSEPYAYAIDSALSRGGLWIMNITEPVLPDTVGHLDFLGTPSEIALSGSFAYVVGEDTSDGGFIKVINVSDPINPYELSNLITDQPIEDIFISGVYAYIVGRFGGLKIFDISDPANPSNLGGFDSPEIPVDVTVSEGYAYISDVGYDNPGLWIVDVTNPVNPHNVGFYRLEGISSVAVQENYAYIAAKYRGLRILNISDPINPYEVGYYESGGDVESVVVSGNFAFIGEGPGDLTDWEGKFNMRVIYIDDPASPFEIGYYNLPAWPWSIISSGLTVYVSDYAGGLVMLEFIPPNMYDITGQVKNSSGTGISGVTISAERFSKSTITGSDGTFRLSGIPEGIVQIYPSRAGYSFLPNSLSVFLNTDQTGQNFIGSVAVCESPISQSVASIDEISCALPLAKPFLYLPVETNYPAYIVLQDTDFTGGGRIDSWFDHKWPTYGFDGYPTNYTIELFDGIERTEWTSTPGGISLSCYNNRCYDGHDGLDFSISDGPDNNIQLNVLAAASGKVLEVCHWDPVNYPYESCSRSPLLGRYIVLSHLDNSYATLYAHLESIDEWIRPGASVVRNDYSSPTPIGTMGCSGMRECHVHLHFQVFFNGYNHEYWTPDESEVVDPFGWQPLDGSIDDWKWPSVPLWLNYSPISCIPSTGCTNMSSGRVSVLFPDGSISADQGVMLILTTLGNSINSIFRSLGSSFSLNLFDFFAEIEGNPATPEELTSEVSDLVTVNVDYAGLLNSHLDTEELSFYRYNSTSNTWEPQVTALDSENFIASAQLGSEGHYDIQAPLVCPADSTEPGDDSPSINNVLPALQQDTTLLRWFDIEEDRDWFGIYGIAGITYNIQTQNLAPGVDTILTLYDKDGETILVTDDNSGDGTGSIINYVVPENAVYYVQASPAPGSAYGCDSSYQITISSNMQTIFLPVIDTD